jgi:hypothetical protein
MVTTDLCRKDPPPQIFSNATFLSSPGRSLLLLFLFSTPDKDFQRFAVSKLGCL